MLFDMAYILRCETEYQSLHDILAMNGPERTRNNANFDIVQWCRWGLRFSGTYWPLKMKAVLNFWKGGMTQRHIQEQRNRRHGTTSVNEVFESV
jgi:hypothetical protein